MSVVTENMKHIYQNRSCLVFMIIVTAITVPVDLMLMLCGDLEKVSWQLPGIWWISVLAFSLSALRVDIMTKGFSYCMPGGKGLAWQVLLVFGAAGAIIWSLKSVVLMVIYGFLKPSSVVSMTLMMIMAAQVSYYLILFWLNAWLGTKINMPTGIGVVIFELLILNKFKIEPYAMEPVQQAVVVMVGLVVTYMSWNYWTRSGMAKDYIGKVWICSLGDASQSRIEKSQRSRAEKVYEKKGKQIEGVTRAEDYFMGKINAAERGSKRQYMWGSIYCHFGAFMPEKKVISLMIFVFWGALIGATSYSRNINGFWFLFPFMMQIVTILTKRDFIMAGVLCGRENIYRSIISVVFYWYRAILVVMAIAMIFTAVCKLFLPGIEIGGKVYTPEFKSLLILLFVGTIVEFYVLSLCLLWYMKPVLSIGYLVLQPTIMIYLTVKCFFPMNPYVCLYAFGWICICLGIFMKVLKMYCERCDLVVKKK